MKIILSFILAFFTSSFFAHFSQYLSNNSILENEFENFEFSINLENRFDSIRILQLTKFDGQKKKHFKIKGGSYIILKTKDSLIYKGKLVIIDSNSVQIKNQNISIRNIRIIKKPVLATIVVGNTFGYIFTVLSIGLLESQGVEEALTVAPLAVPFYAMNFIRRRYDLEKKWSPEVKFERIKKKKRR